MKINIRNLALTAIAVASLSACTEIETYPDGRVDFGEIFTTNKLTAGYLNGCYNTFLTVLNQDVYYTDPATAAVTYYFMDALTDNAQDVDDLNGGQFSMWKNGALTAFNNPIKGMDRWGQYYNVISRLNIFLNNLDDAVVLLESDRTRWRGEAHGLRAYFYYRLAKNYGGVPIILDQKDYSDYDYSKVEPATYNEVARQILADCQEVLDNSEIGWNFGNSSKDFPRMTKAIASAIMSEVALFAASPLYADEPDAMTWAEAADICKKAMNDCMSNGYALFKTVPNATDNANMIACTAYDNMFMKEPTYNGANDKECILGKTRVQVWNSNTAPILTGHTSAGACPSQELIDCYETTDGKRPILGYADAAHLQPIINPDATLYDEKNPYANRDPRLKATVYYNGAHGHLREDTPKPTIYTCKGATHEQNNSSVKNTRTGYYLHKYFNITSTRTANNDGWMREFRLAELMLNYAEAAFEANGAANMPADARKAINDVRDRVKMPALPTTLTDEEMRDRIRNERRIEFAFENHRYYDIRRWKILDQTAVVTGMVPANVQISEVQDVDGKGEPKVDEFGDPVMVKSYSWDGYERIPVSESKAVSTKYLRLPVPIGEATNLKSATGKNFQNEGW